MLADLIAGLASRLSLPVPTPDALGGYTITFADGYSLLARETRGGITLTGAVCAVPEEAEAKNALCRELLTLSLGRAGRECKRSLPRLALHGSNIVLLQRSPAGPTQDAFDAAVEEFLNLLEKWTGLAKKERQQQAFRSGGTVMGFIVP